MATLLTLRRRMKAAQNVSKTTRAMQMIAASKLKRAQEAALSSRPYVDKLLQLTRQVASRVEEKNIYPYIQPQNIIGRSLVIALSPDRGLCGGLVTNLLREFLNFQSQNAQAAYIAIGKKLEGRIIKLSNEVVATFPFGTTLPAFDMVYPISKLIDEYYLGNKVDSVKVLYTGFASIFSQTPSVATLLPIDLPESEKEKTSQPTLFEPSLTDIMPGLLRHYLEMSLFQSILESYVSEQAARMIAMQNATNNAKDIIEGLRLEYNKTRQAKITSELLDITSSRRALHHG